VNRVVFALTLRQVLGRRRTLVMGLFAAIPVLIAVVFQLTAGNEPKQEFAAEGIGAGLVLSVVLPFIALVLGTAVVGAEIDDGTLVYVLSKPESRATILVTKLVVAFLATAIPVVGAALLGCAIAVAGEPQAGILPGFALAAAAGAFAYCCLFVLLSVLTGRALIVGLVYVFVWEGLVTGLFQGTRNYSVRECAFAIADHFADVPEYEASIDVFPSLAIVAVIAVVAVVLAIRRLERFELSERT
jgi:ABC-2 type transport system permease protein